MIVKGGEPLYVMSVEHHKTSLEGFAKVVIDPVDHGRIIQYIEAIRPLQDFSKESPYVFILTGCHQIASLSSKSKKVGAKYGLSLPSVSRVRKIGATSVALQLGDSAQARHKWSHAKCRSLQTQRHSITSLSVWNNEGVES